jgi:NTE family protein
MGAIIGGLYAAGYSPEDLQHLAERTNWSDVFNYSDDSHRPDRTFARKDEKASLLSLRFNGFFKPVLPQAISSGQRLTMLLNSLVINAPYGSEGDFLHDMTIPFAVLATDIVTGTRRIITQGDLTSAIRASATIPLRFNPLASDTALLVDGGLLSNIPIDVAKDSAGADIVIASNTTAELRNKNEISSPFDVADQVITLMMRKENVASIKRADLVMTPELEHGTPDDFTKSDLYIESGKDAARRALPKIRDLLSNTSLPKGVPDHDSLLLPIVKEIVLHCNSKNLHDSLLAIIDNIKGKSLSVSVLKKNIEIPIISYMRKGGFSLARIDSIHLDHPSGKLEIHLDEGRIGNISIKGLHTVQRDLVLREFSLSSGDIFHLDAAEKGLRNLTATGYFSFTSLNIINSRNEGIVGNSNPPSSATSIEITVEERATNILRLAALADNEFGAQFSMQYANENVFGFGTEFSLTGGIGSLSRYAVAELSSPQLLLRFTTFDLKAYAGFKDISAYSLTPDIPNGKLHSKVTDVIREERDFGSMFRLGGEVSRLALLTGEIRFERQKSFSVRTQDIIEPLSILTALKGELTIDSRDDNAYPHDGTFFIGNYEIGTGLLGGTKRYTKIYGAFEQVIPLSGLHTLIPKVAIGLGDRTVPRLEQFDLGGIESFYGLNAYELRGKQMVKGSLTYQIAIPNTLLFPTYVTFRYDVGALWVEPESIKFDALVHGIGAQVGFKTPIGLARFAIGENFRFADSKDKPLLLNYPVFYFSVGANL